jgi:hypothetical protein
MPTTVFRIQNKEGQGPYTNPLPNPLFCTDAQIKLWQMRDRHDELQHKTPSPYRDGMNSLKSFPGFLGRRDIRYCFVDMESLNKWFLPFEQVILRENGFEIIEIQAEEIIWMGNSGQCVVHVDDIL